MNSSLVRIPLNQEERARQGPENLLPLQVYRDIEKLLEFSIDKIGREKPKVLDDLDCCRAHESILVEGERGTGKSSVLVNILTYLKRRQALGDEPHNAPRIFDRLLVLKPIDPTLLEDGDDLLLNVIVSALLRNKFVNECLGRDEQSSRGFYEQLKLVGQAIESVQTAKDRYGLDRMRSYMGSHGLAQEIHLLFRQVLKLTGKELLVLTIDDVDTSLQHAFENLEIVRKYLASPYVVPIISGNLKLYSEVIWRDAHARIMQNSRGGCATAMAEAQELAQEYLRKVLPFPRRLRIPDVSEYLQSRQIIIDCSGEGGGPTLRKFKVWLEVLFNGCINGVDDSHLCAPVFSVRQLAQIIFATKSLIPQWHQSTEDIDDLARMKRWMTVSSGVSALLDAFAEELRTVPRGATGPTMRSNREAAYRNLRSGVEALAPTELISPLLGSKKSWITALDGFFSSDPASAKYALIMRTWLTWLGLHDASLAVNGATALAIGASATSTPALALPLFNPLMQSELVGAHAVQMCTHPLGDDWRSKLDRSVAPEGWLKRLPDRVILPYPVPDFGRQMSSLRTCKALSIGKKNGVHFLYELMVDEALNHRSQVISSVYCGRLFELVITSLIKRIDINDVQDMLTRPPFYSLTALTGTRAQAEGEGGPGTGEADEPGLNPTTSDEAAQFIASQIDAINEWHNKLHAVAHPWLIYNVMNRFFQQVPVFSVHVAEGDNFGSEEEMVRIAAKATNWLWATFGHFEKGPMYGLDTRLSRQNVGRPDNFRRSDLYWLNVWPLSRMPDGVPSFTKALAEHPVFQWIKRLLDETTAPPAPPQLGPPALKARPSSERDMLADIVKKHLDDWKTFADFDKPKEALLKTRAAIEAEVRAQNLFGFYQHCIATPTMAPVPKTWTQKLETLAFLTEPYQPVQTGQTGETPAPVPAPRRRPIPRKKR